MQNSSVSVGLDFLYAKVKGFLCLLFLSFQDLHESLSKVYGVPGWASLLLMGLLLIIAGLLLGMVSKVNENCNLEMWTSIYTCLGDRVG